MHDRAAVLPSLWQHNFSSAPIPGGTDTGAGADTCVAIVALGRPLRSLRLMESAPLQLLALRQIGV